MSARKADFIDGRTRGEGEKDFDYLRGVLPWQVFMIYQDHRATIDDFDMPNEQKNVIRARLDASMRYVLSEKFGAHKRVDSFSFSKSLIHRSETSYSKREPTESLDEQVVLGLLSGVGLSLLHESGRSGEPGYTAVIF